MLILNKLLVIIIKVFPLGMAMFLFFFLIHFFFYPHNCCKKNLTKRWLTSIFWCLILRIFLNLGSSSLHGCAVLGKSLYIRLYNLLGKWKIGAARYWNIHKAKTICRISMSLKISIWYHHLYSATTLNSLRENLLSFLKQSSGIVLWAFWRAFKAPTLPQ